MILDIFSDIGKFMKPVQNFIEKNYGNPLFWIAIVGIVLGLFTIAYSVLHKGE